MLQTARKIAPLRISNLLDSIGLRGCFPPFHPNKVHRWGFWAVYHAGLRAKRLYESGHYLIPCATSPKIGGRTQIYHIEVLMPVKLKTPAPDKLHISESAVDAIVQDAHAEIPTIVHAGLDMRYTCQQ